MTKWPFVAALSMAQVVQPSERLACSHFTADKWPYSAA
eukprot:CAMPEP_0206392172 /NCGR_PEP_ID=MMETSP0294-20121207/19800_1 /ASSEMBLY_ACC=CAM_ASM_000327 /TAXON_ID=39354 /ORGANISM="Heterosigma akashiwo, Strain CCMP2393" /LENGTH=37 /DNA_ID= /DNA_START= /DNA_END= /DNA_ORIENTATION=